MPKRRANGEGSIYLRADGKWCAQYIDFNGRKRYLYGKTQQEVRKKLQDALRRKDDGYSLEPKSISVSDWVKEWLDNFKRPMLRESTYSASLLRWKHHIEPYFSKIKLTQLKAEQIQAFLNEKAVRRLDGKQGGYSVSMIGLLWLLIDGSLQKAVELGYIVKNPCDACTKIRGAKPEKRILTKEEQKRFESTVLSYSEKNPNAVILLLILRTGLRIGEALGLRISDISFENREIYVQRTVGYITKPEGTGVAFYVAPPKSKKGKRKIPLTENTIKLLQNLINERNNLINACMPRWKEKEKNLRFVDEGYLFLTSGGNVTFKHTVDRMLSMLYAQCNIIEPRVSLHGLRHTFATRWIEAGLDVRTLADILGHADVKLTLNTYAHALPEQKQRNLYALEDFIAHV